MPAAQVAVHGTDARIMMTEMYISRLTFQKFTHVAHIGGDFICIIIRNGFNIFLAAKDKQTIILNN